MSPKDKFKTYITSLKPSDKIAILHHTDADGICAGIITKKSIKKITGISIRTHFHQNHGKITITQQTIAHITENRINKLIVVDMAIDHDPDSVKKLEKHAEILQIDHHQKTNNISSSGTTMLKAEDLKDIPPDKYPASKMCYDLFSELTDINELSWLAAVGIYGDYAQSRWQEFLKKTQVPLNKLEEVEELIFYSGSIKGIDGLKDSFDILDTAKNIDTVLKSKLTVYKNTVIDELNKYLDAHKKDAVFHDNLIIYEIAPIHRIKSRLINILSQKHYPSKTVILIQKEGDTAYISARRNDSKLSMNDMLKHALKGIPDSQGGGHIPAAGGYLPTGHISEFKSRVITYCKEKDVH